MQWILNNLDDARKLVMEVSEDVDGQDVAEAGEADSSLLLQFLEDA